MKRFFLSALILSQILGCKSENVPPQRTQDIAALYQQFHGQYKIIGSVTSEPVDVNMDGIASTNLLTEIEELQTGTITSPYSKIRISKPSSVNPEPSFRFIQNWPEQYLRMGQGKVWDGIEMISFNPGYTFDYDMKVVIRNFSFSDDLKKLTVISDDSEKPFFKQSLPKSISVQSDGKLVVITNRRIYTSAGVKEVIITTTYERFTMTT